MIAEVWRRLLNALDRRRFDRELREEIRLHTDLRAAKLREAGVTPGDAEQIARRNFGNELLVREESRDAWGWAWVEALVQDVRYALRQFRRNMAFSAIAVMTLA